MAAQEGANGCFVFSYTLKHCTLHFVKESKKRRRSFLRSKVRNKLILFNSFCWLVGITVSFCLRSGILSNLEGFEFAVYCSLNKKTRV